MNLLSIILALFVAVGRIAYAQDDTNPAYVIQDANYNVVGIFNKGATATTSSNLSNLLGEQYSWTPYGEVSAKAVNSGLPHSRIGHQGLFWDTLEVRGAEVLKPGDAGIYYNRNRFYSPKLGRFLNRDPNESGTPTLALAMNAQSADALFGGFALTAQYGDGANLHAYLGANPVSTSDSMGLSAFDDDVNSAMTNYATDLLGVAGRLAEARAGLAKGAALAAAYAAAAFLWDGVIWDRDEAILLGLVTGGFFARACFEEGTTVLLQDGTSAPVEDVEVGAFLHSWPADPAATLADTTLNPDTWRLIHLELGDSERGAISINLLRPIEWITSTRAEPGRAVVLTVPDLGLRGLATVCSIEPCPAEASGPLAGMVTGTFATEKARTVSVYIESLAEPIGATASHPFFSVDRRAWTAAGQLRPGERVRTVDGEATIARVEVRAASQSVYNLEVQGTHTYFVSKARVWVHNACVFPKNAPKLQQ